MENLNLKYRILVPLSLVLLALLGINVYSVYIYYQRDVAKRAGEAPHHVKQLLASEVNQEARSMRSVLYALLDDTTIHTALKRKNRTALYKRSKPLFDLLYNTDRITHFYFHSTDWVNILRVHQPRRFGDKINRFTARQAKQTGKIASGIELGPLGTFTLRVVMPWYDKKQLIGYVELGKEIEYILRRVRNILNVELYVFIDKKFLNRRGWQQGMRMLGRKHNWDQLPKSALIYQTLKVIPDKLAEIISRSNGSDDSLIDTSLNNKAHQGKFISLDSASGQRVGKILVLYDVSSRIADRDRTIVTVAGISLLLGSGLIWLFAGISGRTEQKLAVSRFDLSK